MWCQFDFERKAAKEGLVPVSEDGIPQIFVTPAEEAMVAAWDHYVNGVDDNEDRWWEDGQVWRRANNVKLTAPPVPPSEALKLANADTRFDDEGRSKSAEAAASFDRSVRQGAQSLMSGGESFDEFASLGAASAAGRVGSSAGGADF